VRPVSFVQAEPESGGRGVRGGASGAPQLRLL